MATTISTLQNKGLTASRIATPGAITITQQGTPGTVTVTYKLVAILADGVTTEAGAASTTTTSNATLTAGNYNRLTWSAVPGAQGYRVYRTVAPTTPSTTGLIVTTTLLTYDDTALAGDSTTPPTTNATGNVSAEKVVYSGDGTVALPSHSFTSDPDTGLYNIGANNLGIAVNGTKIVDVSTTRVLSTLPITSSVLVEQNTDVAATPKAIAAVDSGKTFHNTTAAALNCYTLPSGSGFIGHVQRFIVMDADGIKVSASGTETITIDSTTGAVDGYATSTTIGNVLELTKVTATQWVATTAIGTWQLSV